MVAVNTGIPLLVTMVNKHSRSFIRSNETERYMTKNGEDFQSKVVAEVKQTTVALYEACTSSRILILSARPIREPFKNVLAEFVR